MLELLHWNEIILLFGMNSFHNTIKSFLDWIHSKYLSWPGTSGDPFSLTDKEQSTSSIPFQNPMGVWWGLGTYGGS